MKKEEITCSIEAGSYKTIFVPIKNSTDYSIKVDLLISCNNPKPSFYIFTSSSSIAKKTGFKSSYTSKKIPIINSTEMTRHSNCTELSHSFELPDSCLNHTFYIKNISNTEISMNIECNYTIIKKKSA